MKSLIFIKTILIVAAILIMLSFNKCAGGNQLPPEVCTYGTIVCETGNYVCENFPVPEPICTYFNLACINLTVLCNTSPESDEYKIALRSLDSLNVQINKFLISTQANNK